MNQQKDTTQGHWSCSVEDQWSFCVLFIWDSNGLRTSFMPSNICCGPKSDISGLIPTLSGEPRVVSTGIERNKGAARFSYGRQVLSGWVSTEDCFEKPGILNG